MIYPKFLKTGSLISVPAPSDGAYSIEDVNRYKNAKKVLERNGFRVELSKNIYNSKMGRSASKEERGKEFNQMAKNSDMLLCATGGEFLIECLDEIDFEAIKRDPILVEGFSDPTGILFPLTIKYDVASIYGNNFSTFGMENTYKGILDNIEILKGNIIDEKNFDLYEDERAERITGLEGYNLTKEVYWNILGDAQEVNVKGRVFAGCLDLIDLLLGTMWDGTKQFLEKYKNDGIIWCFDNCDLSKEQLIRLLWKLDTLGYFKYTNAVVFGRCGNDNSILGYNMKNALFDSKVSKLNIPIIYDADISHKGPSLTIINGSILTLNVKNGKATLHFDLT